jgi:hypothetical protein
MGFLISIILRLLTRRLGLLFLGPILLIIGLIVGVAGTSHISFEKSNDSTTYFIAKGDTTGNVYIHAEGSSEYYVALPADISPTITDTEINNSKALSFVYRTDTTDVNFNPSSGSTVTSAHEIEKLVFYDSTGNTVLNTYNTSDYTANSNGIDKNEWPLGGGLAALGAVLLGFGVFRAARKRDVAPLGASAPVVPGAMPYQQPYGQPPAPYGAPVPPASPYAQPQQQAYNPYGQPQQPASPYAQPQQPANPYGQPYSNPQQQAQPTQYAPPPQNPYGQ